ncbi:hypothetical protein [uncultured Bradyrhizobium sp.]|uniref:hypothetical protein n=1 Tax=uncultured Bradyrhizobium sp. TaxID=199684 RepID=UPI0035CB593E
MRIRAFGAAAIIALLAAPAIAQDKPVPRYGDVAKPKTPGELEQEKEAERAYKRSLGNVPEKGPVDPWGNARSVETPKAARATAKADLKNLPAKPKTKTGEAVR